MTLQAGTGFVLGPDGDEDPEVPGEIPRHGRDGRPKIRRPDDPTRFAFYSRASSFGGRIDNTFNIDQARMRRVALGMATRPDLCELAAAHGDLENVEHKRELLRIADLAEKVTGSDVKANRGTALHKYAERKLRGEDLAFIGPQLGAALDAHMAILSRFEVLATELFGVCDQHGVAGTTDLVVSPLGIMHAPDGTEIGPGDVLIADLKSGAHLLKYGKVGPTVQLTEYSHMTPYVHVGDAEVAHGASGRAPWGEGEAPRTDWALIVHVPVDSPQDAGLWWINLTRGRVLSELAASIRCAQKVDDLFAPAELPVEVIVPPVGNADEWEARRLIHAATSTADLEAVYARFAAIWPSIERMATKRWAELAG